MTKKLGHFHFLKSSFGEIFLKFKNSKMVKLKEIAKIYEGIGPDHRFIQDHDFIVTPFYNSYRFIPIQSSCILLTDHFFPILYPSKSIPNNILYSIHSPHISEIFTYLQNHTLKDIREIFEIEIEVNER